mmetsp:Transcript_24071/g.27737  ORF Transcript_24071/g.27737 Transcript_24071/m.27737 type:complete len:204 (+) Transcript_24071:3109-3720(+)
MLELDSWMVGPFNPQLLPVLYVIMFSCLLLATHSIFSVSMKTASCSENTLSVITTSMPTHKWISGVALMPTLSETTKSSRRPRPPHRGEDRPLSTANVARGQEVGAIIAEEEAILSLAWELRPVHTTMDYQQPPVPIVEKMDPFHLRKIHVGHWAVMPQHYHRVQWVRQAHQYIRGQHVEARLIGVVEAVRHLLAPRTLVHTG